MPTSVVLPAAVWGEKEGTFTNSERRVSRVRAGVEPPGDARTDSDMLSATEARLLSTLAGRANVVLSKRELATAVWRDPALDLHAVEMAVMRLRRRMGSLGTAIAVVHRRGYALRT